MLSVDRAHCVARHLHGPSDLFNIFPLVCLIMSFRMCVRVFFCRVTEHNISLSPSAGQSYGGLIWQILSSAALPPAKFVSASFIALSLPSLPSSLPQSGESSEDISLVHFDKSSIIQWMSSSSSSTRQVFTRGQIRRRMLPMLLEKRASKERAKEQRQRGSG